MATDLGGREVGAISALREGLKEILEAVWNGDIGEGHESLGEFPSGDQKSATVVSYGDEGGDEGGSVVVVASLNNSLQCVDADDEGGVVDDCGLLEEAWGSGEKQGNCKLAAAGFDRLKVKRGFIYV